MAGLSLELANVAVGEGGERATEGRARRSLAAPDTQGTVEPKFWPVLRYFLDDNFVTESFVHY